jgi:hypothetical protein
MISPELFDWDKCDLCGIRKVQVLFYFRSCEWRQATRRVVSGLSQSIEAVEGYSGCCTDGRWTEGLCLKCVRDEYGPEELRRLGIVDWTDDPTDEPLPRTTWSWDEREEWLRRRAGRYEVAEGHRVAWLTEDVDMFEDVGRLTARASSNEQP